MEQEKVIKGKTLGAWKKYAEEHYDSTPIHVLKYIIILEEELKNQNQTIQNISLFCDFCGSSKLQDCGQNEYACQDCGHYPIINQIHD